MATGHGSRERKNSKSSVSSLDGSEDAARRQSIGSTEARPPSLERFDSASASGQSDCACIVTFAVAELFCFLGEGEDTKLDIYDTQNLPPEVMVRNGVEAFIAGTESLFFTYQRLDALNILDQVYAAEEGPDPLALAEVLAMAAVGSVVSLDAVPREARKPFLCSCARMLKGLRGVDDLRYMRLFTVLAIRCLMENSTRAHGLISAATQIGRFKLQLSQDPGYDSEKDRFWRRVFRTVIFVESWLSYSLRRRSMINSTDKAYASLPTASGPRPESTDEEI